MYCAAVRRFFERERYSMRTRYVYFGAACCGWALHRLLKSLPVNRLFGALYHGNSQQDSPQSTGPLLCLDEEHPTFAFPAITSRRTPPRLSSTHQQT